MSSNANFQVFLAHEESIYWAGIGVCSHHLFSVRNEKAYLIKMQMASCTCIFDSECLCTAQIFNQLESLCEFMKEAGSELVGLNINMTTTFERKQQSKQTALTDQKQARQIYQACVSQD